MRATSVRFLSITIVLLVCGSGCRHAPVRTLAFPDASGIRRIERDICYATLPRCPLSLALDVRLEWKGDEDGTARLPAGNRRPQPDTAWSRASR